VVKFEHVVIVNEPDNPMVEDMTREELWFGLLCRVEDPRPFLPGLEGCSVLDRSEDELVRELDFGELKIRDRVTLVPMESVTFEAQKTAEHAGGTLTIRIEEPVPEQLVLRFMYATTLEEERDGGPDMIAQFVRSAYHESDIDTVRVIRGIVASGRMQ
jgi:hypothetical protein